MRSEDEAWYSDVEVDDVMHYDRPDEWDDSIDMSTFELTVGLKFPNSEKFREVLKDWSVRKGYDLKYPKCEANVVTAKCKGGCDWHLRASVIQRGLTFQIKKIRGRHTCAYRTENTQADYKYLGRRILESVKDNQNESLEGLENKIKRDCGVECTMFKVYKAKNYAVSLLSVVVGVQYARLYDYCLTVVNHNPGSSLFIKVNTELSPPKFKRMYVCLAAMKKAFLSGCRPIIGLDGCFLKGLHAGQLLSAVGRDGNDNMLPIAITYVEVEKHDSWEWFLELLLKDIGSANDNQWAFISDRQKGLIEDVNEAAPTSEHRFCVKNMHNNFKTRFSGLKLKKLFWKAASTYSVRQHHRTMKEIKKLCPKRGQDQTPYEWLTKIPAQHWARCFFPITSKCDVIVNNLSESFNSCILPARDLAIIDIFEWMRKRFMTRLQVTKTSMEKYTEIVCPNIITTIETQRNISRKCYASWAGEDKFEVMQLCGYPCCHAVACISLHRLNVQEYVSDFFKKEMYLRVYSHIINLVPCMHDYEDSSKGPINPPDVRMKRGRPKKKRRPDGNDKMLQGKASRNGLSTTCGICGKIGHNQRSCPNKPEAHCDAHNAKFQPDDDNAQNQGQCQVQEEIISLAFQEIFGWAQHHDKMPQQNKQATIPSSVEDPTNTPATSRPPRSRKQQPKRRAIPTKTCDLGSNSTKFNNKN